jgi:hypothetical protein
MLPSDTTAQIVFRTAVAALFAIGALTLLTGLGLLKRRGRLRAEFSAGRAQVGLLMLVAGTVFCLLRPVLVPAPAPEGEVITKTRFSSESAPILFIEMPPGWTFTFDRAAGRLRATDIRSTLLIETSRVTDEIDPPGLMKLVSDTARAAGATVGDTFNEPIAGLNGLGLSIASANQTSTVWYVPRGGPLLTVVTCRTEIPGNAREACGGPLATLKWRTPPAM